MMFSEKIEREKMARAVSDRIFDRAQQDAEALRILRQSNPNAVPATENSFSSSNATVFSLTREERERAISNRIFERAAQDREALLKISTKSNNVHPNGNQTAPPVVGPSLFK